MATKVGLSYYTVDTDRYLDIRIKRLRKDYGCRGLAVYDYVLCEIYRDRGCFIEWGESTAFDVAEYLGLKESVVQEIVKYCAVVGLFNEALLRRGIITSASIQKRYLDMATRAKRKTVTIPGFCKLPEFEAQLPEVGAEIPEVGAQLRENSGSWTQIKENKSKVNTPYNPPKGENERASTSLCSDTNPERKEKVARKRKDLDLSFVEPAFQPIMADWLAYKSERGQTYRQKGVEGCYAHLKALSGDDPAVARKIVEQSIAFNYAGLFPLKQTTDVRTTTHQPSNHRASNGDITNEEVMRRCRERVAERLAREKAREMGIYDDAVPDPF